MARFNTLYFAFCSYSDLMYVLRNNTKSSEDFSSMMISLIFLHNFLISWCLSANSMSITNLAIFFFSLYPTLLIDKLAFANIGIIASRLQHLIKSMSTSSFTYFLFSFSYQRTNCFVTLSHSHLCCIQKLKFISIIVHSHSLYRS